MHIDKKNVMHDYLKRIWCVDKIKLEITWIGLKIKIFIGVKKICLICESSLNPLRPGQKGRTFPDDIFKRAFLNENVRFPIEMSLNVVPRRQMNNVSALAQITAWRR